MEYEGEIEPSDPFPALPPKVNASRACAGTNCTRKYTLINSSRNKFCESCRPLKHHSHSPVSAPQKKRDSSTIYPLASEAEKSPAFSLEEIDMDFLKTLSREDLQVEFEAVVKVEYSRRARMMDDIDSMKNLRFTKRRNHQTEDSVCGPGSGALLQQQSKSAASANASGPGDSGRK